MKSRIEDCFNRISPYCKQTPLEYHERLSKLYDCKVYLKREDQQLTRSFKIRGALNKISRLTEDEKNRGIVCASAGNHAQGIALSAKLFKIPCNIFLPSNTPSQKIKQIEYYSDPVHCKITVQGSAFQETLQIALDFAKQNNKVFVHPFNDQDVIDGQGTIAYEISKQLIPDIILCPLGGGGLVSGIVQYFNKHSSWFSMFHNNVSIIGVEPENNDSMKKSIEKDELVTLVNDDNFVDGAAVKRVGELTFKICKDGLSEILVIDKNRLCYDMIDLVQKDGIITEPAGALSISGLYQIKDKIKGKTVVCVISGGNNDITRYSEIMEKSLQYQNLLHYYLLEFNQVPGELKKFINNIIGEKDDIIRFEYVKKTNRNKGNVLVGLQVDNTNNVLKINLKLKEFGFKYKKIESNDLLYGYLI